MDHYPTDPYIGHFAGCICSRCADVAADRQWEDDQRADYDAAMLAEYDAAMADYATEYEADVAAEIHADAMAGLAFGRQQRADQRDAAVVRSGD